MLWCNLAAILICEKANRQKQLNLSKHIATAHLRTV